jgi:hypothetical protein
MNQQQNNLIRSILDRVILHSHPYYPGYKSQFVATFSSDEIQEIKNIIQDLKNEKD